jgi:NADH dehydrogenase
VRRARVVLVEPTDRVLGAFPRSLSASARRVLARRGVEVVLGVGVARADEKSVELTDGSVVPAATLVWTAGVTASPLARVLAEQLGDEVLTRGGRVVVEDDLSLSGHPEVSVIGDLAAATDERGEPLPQLAPVAMQAGALVARNVLARAEGRPTETFRYVDRGSMATIGRHAAVAQLPGGIRLRGTVGWLSWLLLHLVMLVGFRNRVNVLVNWAWSYLTYDRASRLILDDAHRQGQPTRRPEQQ